MKTPILIILLSLVCTMAGAADKPNILVIMGDDIGIFNLSTYHHGFLGYSTPNIDRIRD